MRITIDDLYCEKSWYGVDKKGRIIEFFGVIIPEFVCVSKENTEILEDFFETEVIGLTDYIVGNKRKLLNKNGRLEKQRKGKIIKDNSYFLIDKGIYFFNEFDRKKVYKYIKELIPLNPLLITDLPQNIQEILSNNFLDIDVDEVKVIIIKDAYSD